MMNIESNIDSVSIILTWIPWNTFPMRNWFLRNKQLANEKRYSIGELRLVKDDDSLFEENIKYKIERLF